MNGFIKKALVGMCLGGSALSVTGCQCSLTERHRKCVDPCYPQRYNYMARNEVLEGVINQSNNGHILDQTVWNRFFDVDTKGQPTDKLNALGREHLAYLTRRRPNPDPKIYLQTSHDLGYNAADPPEANAQKRAELDSKRLLAVHQFLAAQTAGRNLGFAFVVTIHDPAEVGLAATAIGGNTPPLQTPGAVPRLYSNFQGVLPNVGTFGTPGGGGGIGAGAPGGTSGTTAGGSPGGY